MSRKTEACLVAAVVTCAVLAYKLKNQKPVYQQPIKTSQPVVIKKPIDDDTSWMEDPRYQDTVRQRVPADKMQTVVPQQTKSKPVDDDDDWLNSRPQIGSKFIGN
jgi:hypothetical protein